MADDSKARTPFSLKRWSQRKLAAARAAEAEPTPPPAAATTPGNSPVTAIPGAAPAVAAETPLPPVESLTFDSDFAAFMQPKVDETTKRAALKKLFSDPSFNLMDGLDIYVGDYTQSDPMPAGMLEKLSAVYAMLDPVEPPRDEQVAKAKDAIPPVAGPARVAGPAEPAQVGTQTAPVADRIASEVAEPGDADKTVKPA